MKHGHCCLLQVGTYYVGLGQGHLDEIGVGMELK